MSAAQNGRQRPPVVAFSDLCGQLDEVPCFVRSERSTNFLWELAG
jgi:hypothetical protein